MAIQIQIRRANASQWTSASTVLAEGEIGFELDTNKLKIGNGSTAWGSLAYWDGGLTSQYQPVDADLTAIAALTGTGLLKRTGTNTWSLDDPANYLTESSASSTYLKQASASTIYAPLASPTFTGTVTAATLNLTTADTATAASHYFVETASDGVIRPKTLANARSEIVTTTAVNSASATVLGTITTGIWQGSEISTTYTTAKVTSVNGSTGAITGLATTAGTLAQFAATTSSQLAGVLSDETGSGSVVFSNSPTLTGTVTINSLTTSGLVTNTSGGVLGTATYQRVNADLMGYTTTATAAGTTTLTSASTTYQLFTGTSTQTVQLPVTSTLVTGWTYHIVNNSTGNVTVNSSGGNQIIIIPPGTTAMATCIDTTVSTAAGWEAGLTDFSTYTGTGSVVLSAGPTFTGSVLGVEDIVPYSKTGTLTTGTGTIRYRFPWAATLLGVTAAVNTAPSGTTSTPITGASLVLDVNKNGTTIFTTQSNRPNIASGGTATAAEPTPDVTSIVAGDYLTVDIDYVGSTTAGADLTVIIRYKRA